MTIICKNCNQHFKGHFCNNCGQSAETHKIDFHFLWHDIQHGIFHFDSGILYTVKQLFTRPGNSIREFIDGKRVKHFKPISLLIVLATIYGLLYHTFHINLTDLVEVKETPDRKIIFEWVNEWMGSHYSWATLLTLPFAALGTFIAFRKQEYNFIEHLVLNAFMTGQRLVLRIALFPLTYFYNGTPTSKIITGLISVIQCILVLWCSIQFFNKLTKTKVFLLTLLSFLILLGSALFTSGLVGGFIGYFTKGH